ncbi:MAG TPA: hypothetical protein VMU14_20745 [Acidimicrobiales bacterium]|nr:hypothetical protein [Acidimicrobiales bacterium]
MIVLQVAIAVVIFAVVMRGGLWLLRVIASDPPPPPPKGELRRIDARYRCEVCGMEMKVTLSPDEEPDPPRHCMEEMALLPR